MDLQTIKVKSMLQVYKHAVNYNTRSRGHHACYVRPS